MWVPLPPPEQLAVVEAARLVLEPEAAWATDLRLDLGEWTWQARRAHVGPTAGCAQLLTFTEGVRLDGPGLTGEASSGALCPGLGARWHDLHLSGGGFRLDAGTAVWSDGPDGQMIGAEHVSLTRCACASPPWHLSAERVAVGPEAVAYLDWPVFYAGAVPVMAAPAWQLPLESRRAGLLWPRLAWRGEDGPAAALPVFVPLGPSVDLTPAPGWDAAAGPTGALRLRWASDPDQAGELHAGGDRRGLGLNGQGSAGLGALQLAADGRWVSDEARQRADARSPEAAFATSVTGRLAAGLASPDGVAAARLATHLDRRTAEERLAPALRLGWSAGPAPLRADVDVEVRAMKGDGADTGRLRAGAGLSGETWWGPLRGSARVAQTTAARSTSEAQSTDLAGLAESRLGAAVGRDYGGLVHELGLSLNGRWVHAGSVGDTLPAEEATDRAVPTAAGWVELGNTLRGPTADADLRLAWGADAEASETPWPWATLRSRFGPFGLESRFSDGDTLWTRAAAGTSPVELRLGHLHTGDPTDGRQRLGPTPFEAWRPFVDLSAADTLTPGLGVTAGPVNLGWDAFVGLDPSLFLGHAGTARLEGRCDCWEVGLEVQQARPAKVPDVYLTLSLD